MQPFLDIRVLGAPQLRRQLRLMGVRIRLEVEKKLPLAAQVMIRAIQEEMGGSRTRAYRKRRAVTSRPDQIGIDTGFLRRSIGARSGDGVYRKGRTSRGSLFIEFGTRVKYGLVHELGMRMTTRSGTTYRMPKRPFFEPGIKKSLPQVRQIVDGVLRMRA